jgi:Ca2+-binding EF-hand superfamily protein
MRAAAAQAAQNLNAAQTAREAAADGLVAARPDPAKIKQDLARARNADLAARSQMEDALVAFAVTREPKAREHLAEGLRHATPKSGRHMMTAIAAPMDKAEPGKMAKPDLNKDGKISLAEFQQSHFDRMLMLDANQDGKISEAEFIAMKPTKGPDGPPPPPPSAEGKSMDHDAHKGRKGHKSHKTGMGPGHEEHQAMMFDLLDRNDDGFITTDEVNLITAKHFKRMDKNGDGFLTPDERPKWGKGKAGHDHDGPEPK